MSTCGVDGALSKNMLIEVPNVAPFVKHLHTVGVVKLHGGLGARELRREYQSSARPAVSAPLEIEKVFVMHKSAGGIRIV